MQRSLVGAIVLTFILCVSPIVSAAVIAEIVDTAGDVHSLTLSGVPLVDAAFSVDVVLTNSFPVVSAQMKVQSLDGTGIFKLSTRTINATPGWDTGSGALTFTSPDTLTGAPSGISSQDIGTLAADVFVGVPAGTATFVTLDGVVLAGTPPGDYRLNLTSIKVGNTDFQAVFGDPGADYVVHVLPEPATLVLLGGLAMLIPRRGRRCS